MQPNFSANCVKGVQGVGYLVAFVLSLLICVPMSMHQDQFKGRCALFSTGFWQETDGQFIVDWASQAYCNFTIFVAVIMFVISLIQFGRFIKFIRRGRDSSFFSAFVDVLVCMLMCIFVLIAACFVTFGFATWCKEMTDRFETCSDAAGNPIDKAEGIDSNGFFLQISVAMLGIWLSFSVWVTLFVFSMVKLCRFHHQENLRVSMAKERKRLLNEDLVSEAPPMATDRLRVSRNSSNRRRYGQNCGPESDDHLAEVHPAVDADDNLGQVNDLVAQELHRGSSSQHEKPEADQSFSSSTSSSNSSSCSLPKGNQIHFSNDQPKPDLLD